MRGLLTESTRNNVTINRQLKIEGFRHFPRTVIVKKSRDQDLAVRFAVWGSRLYGLDHAPGVSDLPQGFLNPKTSQPQVWEEIRLFRNIFYLAGVRTKQLRERRGWILFQQGYFAERRMTLSFIVWSHDLIGFGNWVNQVPFRVI